ncbi:MAG: polysaccharide biosynthesis/export family protein [Hyphomicrobiales bacterium]
MRYILAIFILVGLCLPAAAQSAYRLQPGDTIDISVWQEPKLNRTVVVGPDGMISFPLAGQIKAGGKTTAAVEAALKSKLQAQYTADLDISVGVAKQLEKPVKEKKEYFPMVYVTGEVNKPGNVQIDRKTTVLQAIALGGGLGPFAAKKRIQVRRKQNGTEVMFPFNYDDVEEGRDITGNIFLKDGDVIVVPEKGIFE